MRLVGFQIIQGKVELEKASLEKCVVVTLIFCLFLLWCGTSLATADTLLANNMDICVVRAIHPCPERQVFSRKLDKPKTI
jgi:hypothetical protein